MKALNAKRRNKPLKRNTVLKRTKFFSFPIDKKLRIGFARATTNRGVKFIAFTLQSELDKHDETQEKTVLSGRLHKALKAYKKGGKVRGKVQYAGVVPDHKRRQLGIEKKRGT